jgi:hypothetical protein
VVDTQSAGSVRRHDAIHPQPTLQCPLLRQLRLVVLGVAALQLARTRLVVGGGVLQPPR